MTVFTTAYTLSLSLIIAIGAQNAFVLRQGLRRRHVGLVCSLCAVSDAVLIVAGVAGFERLTAAAEWFVPAARYGGAAFLFVYGGRAFFHALRAPRVLHADRSDAVNDSAAAVAATCLALTFLNPHVYLDTVVLLGSVSTNYPGAAVEFAGGAALASFTFFFTLGYAARLLSPLFRRPAAWRILDAGIGVVMWTIAVSLVAAGVG